MHDKILLAKLRAGQQIEVECHATRGLGAEHAKWSPVATAWYRLLPEVRFLHGWYFSPDRACSCLGAGNIVAAKHVPGTQCLRLVPD